MLDIEENIKKLKEFAEKYPNDYDLGLIVRENYRSEELVRKLPNDQLLGKEIRNILRKF